MNKKLTFEQADAKLDEVVAKLENSSPLIKDGMSADVYFDVEDKSLNVKYLLPANSILNDKNGYFIYVVQ